VDALLGRYRLQRSEILRSMGKIGVGIVGDDTRTGIAGTYLCMISRRQDKGRSLGSLSQAAQLGIG
jgi:hypothetical protein